jgi:CRISP-associated protein Cas1
LVLRIGSGAGTKLKPATLFNRSRNAAHPINAMLNYAYAILESQVRIQCVAEGYDPTLGIMHESREGSSAFVFDLMEPERPKVDCSILEFVRAHKFHAADFVIRTDGVCRLNPAMARRVVAHAVKSILP